ncbi:hypothetical protein T11_11708 [Trichinella zimbabwensis]|uniref:Uncharacterized protein n=1 Tax=Trichinella zimbabwensis TaxID=268475 RepID=A0A0V1HJF2_9BILA|nr:hypothetical protein T11_11708 [Trichinella zimbabwensis]
MFLKCTVKLITSSTNNNLTVTGRRCGKLRRNGAPYWSIGHGKDLQHYRSDIGATTFMASTVISNWLTNECVVSEKTNRQPLDSNYVDRLIGYNQ